MRLSKKENLQKQKITGDFLEIYVLTDTHDIVGVSGDPNAYKAVTHGGTRLHFQQKQKIELFVQDVLENKPDAVLGLGDFFDAPAPIENFKQNWSRIPEPKGIMLGNHDYSLMGKNNAESSYQHLSHELQFCERMVNAGSKLNQSFYVNKGDIEVKVIMCDFSLTKDNAGSIVHHANVMGTILPEQLEWIKEELLNSRTNRVILASHHGMHFSFYFADEYATALKDTIGKVKAVNPKLTVLGVFGHNHVYQPVRIENMLPEMLCYNASASIERYKDIEESKHTTYYTVINVYKSKFTVSKRPMTYTGLQPKDWSIYNDKSNS